MASADRNEQDEAENWDDLTPEQAEKQLALGKRLTNWKSIASFVFTAVIIVGIITKAGINPSALWDRLKTLNLGLFLSAFLLYYLTFPIRGYRWKVLLKNAYQGTHDEAVDNMSVRGVTEIIFISWFVNCVVPAKLGDLYRAYLAKLWASISFTKTVGTVLAERILDILVLSVLLGLTGLVVFHSKLGHISLILLLGLGLGIAGVVALVLMKTLSERIHRIVPERFRSKYTSFEEGTLNSFKRIPLLLGLTVVIWLLEGCRLQLVFSSLGLQAHSASGIPFAPMLFFALATAVLTTVPFTPGGLGLVEVGVGSLLIYFGIHKSDAAAVVLVDRILSYYSIAFFGFLVYLLSKRSHFRHPV